MEVERVVAADRKMAVKKRTVVAATSLLICRYVAHNNEYLSGPRYEQLLILVPGVAIMHAWLSLRVGAKNLVRV